MGQPFTAFVIFAAMRTGSNFLEETLKTLPGVTLHGEPFNPAFIAYPNRDTHLGLTRADRDRDPLQLLSRIMSAPGLNGFRYFPGHDPRVQDALIADPAIAKIVLTRNPTESYVSLKIARETGQWKLTDNRRRRDARATFNEDEFGTYLDELRDFQSTLRLGLQAAGQSAFYLDYAELGDGAVLTGLARYLGVQIDSLPPARSIVPQNPEPLADKVANPDQMAAALARLQPFDILRSPDFEPARGPSVRGFMAARMAPLLFQPLRGGPTDRIRDWLALWGGLDGDFTQASLRDWMRARAPHRRFTVVSHPVLRAWRATQAIFDQDALPALKAQLLRDLKITPATDPRERFLRFLAFAKSGLRGQTPHRPDPLWASQTALVQGLAAFASPDAVLREDRLEQGLASLCADLDLPMQALPPPPPDRGLAAVYGADIEAAARAAYGRDYLTFGFGPYAA